MTYEYVLLTSVCEIHWLDLPMVQSSY